MNSRASTADDQGRIVPTRTPLFGGNENCTGLRVGLISAHRLAAAAIEQHDGTKRGSRVTLGIARLFTHGWQAPSGAVLCHAGSGPVERVVGSHLVMRSSSRVEVRFWTTWITGARQGRPPAAPQSRC
jgi:hypothetical protein